MTSAQSLQGNRTLLYRFGDKALLWDSEWAGEIARRRFLQSHHHLISPLFYTPQARVVLDSAVTRRNVPAEFERVSKPR